MHFWRGQRCNEGELCWLRRVRRDDGGTTGVVSGVSGMMFTLRDVSVTGGILRGGFSSKAGRLRLLRRDEGVVGTTGANVAGV